MSDVTVFRLNICFDGSHVWALSWGGLGGILEDQFSPTFPHFCCFLLPHPCFSLVVHTLYVWDVLCLVFISESYKVNRCLLTSVNPHRHTHTPSNPPHSRAPLIPSSSKRLETSVRSTQSISPQLSLDFIKMSALGEVHQDTFLTKQTRCLIFSSIEPRQSRCGNMDSWRFSVRI